MGNAVGTAVPTPEDSDAASESWTGPGNAQDYSNGYSEASFRVGTDLLAGVWEFTRGSSSTLSAIADHGRFCRHGFAEDGASAERRYVDINGERVRGTARRLPYSLNDTYRFALLQGDTVTLQAAAGDVCEIERVSD